MPQHPGGIFSRLYVSERYQFAWGSNPKVCSTALKQLFWRAERFEDLIWDDAGMDPRLPDEIGLEAMNHSRSSNEWMGLGLRVDWRAITDQADFERTVLAGKHRFCFVRHPFSRFLSAYGNQIAGQWKPDRRDRSDLAKLPKDEVLAYLGRQDADLNSPVSLEEFLGYVEQTPENKRNPHWGSQTRIIRYNKIDYHQICRFETFRDDILDICDKVGIPRKLSRALSIQNSSGSGRFSGALEDPDIVRRLTAIYEEDLDNFYASS